MLHLDLGEPNKTAPTISLQTKLYAYTQQDNLYLNQALGRLLLHKKLVYIYLRYVHSKTKSMFKLKQ